MSLHADSAMSTEQRAAEMAITERQRQDRSAGADERAAERQRLRAEQEGQAVRLGVMRGRVRTAANNMPTAVAEAERWASDTEARARATSAEHGFSGLREYLNKLEADLPEVLRGIAATAAAEQRVINEAHHRNRLDGLHREALKLETAALVAEIEKNGARFEIIDSKLFLRGNPPDERATCYIRARHLEIKALVVARSQLFCCEFEPDPPVSNRL